MNAKPHTGLNMSVSMQKRICENGPMSLLLACVIYIMIFGSHNSCVIYNPFLVVCRFTFHRSSILFILVLFLSSFF